jgi:hypothetical protein
MSHRALASAGIPTGHRHFGNNSGRQKARWMCLTAMSLCLWGSHRARCQDANEWSPGKGKTVWGEVGLSGIFSGARMAPNGVAYDPLFAIDTCFNVGLNTDRTLYLFSEDTFWAQEATSGVTNSRQGSLDFSKREYDLSLGLGWRYWPHSEVRAFGYSFNNLNRGDSATAPSGYKDGVGIENRFHFGEGDDFVGVGYYLTKDMVDQEGLSFKPGLFFKAMLHAPLVPGLATVCLEPELICRDNILPKLLDVDAEIEFTPFKRKDILLDLGLDTAYDLGKEISRTILYFRVGTRF